MLKNVSNFIVSKRNWILGIILLVAAASVFMMQRVEINEDMTKYLPDDSPMKAGMDIMTEEFPEMEVLQTIRVMFDDLTEAQRDEVLHTLEAIPYVDSVDYDPDDEDYNKDNHTLFVLNTEYDYDSEEEQSIEAALDDGFQGYSMVWHNDDTSLPDIPVWVVVVAVAVLMVILFAMCGSWIEPVLFIAVIGVAIVINMGTNLVMGSVSSVTFSIAAILQLVLSMDYSIILINRYRQEKERISGKEEAMKEALAHAFSSIASSSLTTVVGLLMLVFMSFKIGMDLGIVLAKGVFISMVCVLTMLPGIILACDKLIQKTAKKELDIPMAWAGGLSYKLRYGLGVLFILLFVGVYFLQGRTGIVYTLQKEDPVADVFPASNTLVMVYENRDEAAVGCLAEQLEQNENVKSVMAYSTMLAKPYTAEELADEIADMDGEFSLDTSVIDMLYYNYFGGGQPERMTASEFLRFISGTVMENETFSDYIDDGMKDNIDLIAKFADANALTSQRNAKELAEFFGMDETDIKDLLLFHAIEMGGVPTGSMTLPAFADFVVNEVAQDETYGDLFDSNTLEQMERLSTFPDAAKMTTPTNYTGVASLLDMDADTVKLLFVYYYALSDSYTPTGMTLPDFVGYIQTDVASNPTLGASFDADTLAQIDMLAQFTDADTVAKRMTAAELSGLLGMDESMVQQVFAMYYGEQNAEQGISLAGFMDFLVNEIVPDPAFADAFDPTAAQQLAGMQQMIGLAASGTPLDAQMLAGVTGMDAAMVEQLFGLEAMQTSTQVDAMTLPDFLDFLLDDVAQDPTMGAQFDETTLAQLGGLRQMVDLAASGQALPYQQMAQVLGLDETQVRQLYTLYWGRDSSGQTLSLEQIVGFLLSNEVMAGALDEAAHQQLGFLQGVMTAAQSGKVYGHNEMGALLGMDGEMVKMLYTYRESDSAAGGWQLSMQSIINFLIDNSDQLDSMMGSGELAQLQTAQRLINGSVNCTSYTAPSLAELVEMDTEQVEQLYLLYISHHGDTSGWTLSVKDFIDFINSDVLDDPDFAGQFVQETSDMLAAARTLTDAVISGQFYTAAQMGELFEGVSGELNQDTMELMYLYASSEEGSDPAWVMSMETLFHYLVDDVLNDPRFAELIDDEMRGDLYDAQKELEDGKEQLVTAEHSRLIVTSGYPEESAETTAFLTSLTERCADTMEGEVYLIGNSAMNVEMQQIFDTELLFITALTAVAIFLIVALTFRSIFIPLILVLVVQCGVYATVSVIGLQGGSIYYLALLIVECILMGATIDYGILFTNYYCESRAGLPVVEAVKAAYAGSTHTILTSGLILILVTAIVGNFFEEPTVSAIVKTVSIGALCATVIILFILPGLLTVCDRFVTRKSNR